MGLTLHVGCIGRSGSVAWLVGMHRWIGCIETEQGLQVVPLKVHGIAFHRGCNTSGDYLKYTQNNEEHTTKGGF